MNYRILALAAALLAAGCGTSPPVTPNTGSSGAPTATSEKAAADSPPPPPMESAAPTSATEAGAAPKSPGPGSVTVVDEPLAGGALSQQDIARILEKQGDVFGECYTLGAGGANKDYRATVTVKATLGPTGIVNSIEVIKGKTNTKNPKVDTCVADAFKKIKFPAPKKGATSVITFPVKFAGVEEVKQ